MRNFIHVKRILCFYFFPGSSINSQTLPSSPPPYSSLEKNPPPSYDFVIQIPVTDLSKLHEEKKEGPAS